MRFFAHTDFAVISILNTAGVTLCSPLAGVPRGDTPGEGDGEGGPDGERDRGEPGVGSLPTSGGTGGGLATGTGSGPGGAAVAVGGTPKPPKGNVSIKIRSPVLCSSTV